MSILRVEQIQKLDGSDFFPDLSRFLWEEEILTTEGVPPFPEKNKLHLIEGVGGVVYLPIGNDGDRIAFSDKDSNFTSATVTLLPYPNSGDTIGGSNSWQLANDNDSAGFIFYTGNWVPIWSTQSDPTDPNELAPVLYNQENLSALPGFLYLLDGTRNVTLPDAENNDRIGFADYFGRFGQEGYSVTLVPSFPDNIGGDSTYTVSENNAYVEIIYRNGRWIFLESPPSKTLGDGEVLSEGFTFPNDGLRIQDSENQQESLIISPGENLSENRTLTINVNGGDRELNLLGNVTLGGSNSGDQLISLSGDVVAAAGDSNLVTTIQNGSVTFQKMAPVNSGTVVGRLSSGFGDPEELTLTSFKSAISGTDAGDLVILPSNGVLPALSGENLTNVAASLEIRDEGVVLTNAVSAIDFTGATVQATESAGIVTVDLSSTGDATSIQGVNVDSSVGTPSDGDILVYRSAGADFVLESKPATGSNPAAADITDATADGIALITSADANPFTDADETKLDGIATSATANSTDAVLLDRANHTGTQAASTIGSGTFADARISSSSVTQHESSLTITESQISDLGTYRTDLVNTNRILGRISSGTGVIENLTAAQARTLLNVENGATAGVANPVDIFYQSVDALTYSDGGTTTMDNGAFNAFSLTANGTSTTIAHSNVPTTGNEYYFRLHLTWTAGAITWPSSWTKGMNAPTATGDYIVHGATIDGGTSFAVTVEYL